MSALARRATFRGVRPSKGHLDLRLTSIGDSGAAHLGGLSRLRFVNLFRTRVGDLGIAALYHSADLETLLIGGTRITDAGLVSFGALESLRGLGRGAHAADRTREV